MDTSTNETWIVLARVEEKGKTLFSDELRDRDLRRMADSYDPEFRRAPIISGKGIVPAHEGEKLGSLGFVNDLQFDGLNLWGLVEQRTLADGTGMVDQAVADGYLGRSIGAWPSLPELDGNPPYLRHVALLGGEPSGIPNLPPLTDYYASTGGIGRDIASMPYCVRSITDPPPAEKEFNVDEKTLAEMVGAAVARAMADVKPPDNSSAIQEAVTRAVTPLQTQIQALETRAVTAETTTRSATVRSQIDALVKGRQLSPALAEGTTAAVLAMPVEAGDAYLTALRSAPALLVRSVGGIQLPTDSTAVNMTEADIRRYASNGADPEAMEKAAAIRAKANGDVNVQRAEIYRTLGYANGVN